MILRDRRGHLALDALLVEACIVGNRGLDRLLPSALLLVARGDEEPQAVGQDPSPEGGLEDLVDVVQLLLAGVALHGRPGDPVFVLEVDPERAVELVAALLGDRVDHAAGETPVLGRHRAGLDGRFLDRVLDEQGERLAAQVLVDDDAVDQVEVLERHGARDDRVVRGSRCW